MSNKQDEKIFRDKFKGIQRRQKLILIFVAIVYVVLLSYLIKFDEILGQLSRELEFAIAVILILPVVFILINWRCPKCGAFLGRKFTDQCPKCGLKLK
ncbi:MAG: hypothetical protein GX285_08015 [Clostridiales bacterium]|nr:hypothetical protein [Clostridiales bacterium]